MVCFRPLIQLLTVLSVVAIGLVLTAAFPLAPLAGLQPPGHRLSAANLASAAEEVLSSVEPHLASAAVLKENGEQVAHEGYVLALLANEVAAAKGNVQWKGNALAVRDTALELAKAAESANHASTAAAFAKIQQLLRGDGPAAGNGEPMKPLDFVPILHVMEEVQSRYLPLRRKARRKTTFTRERKSIQLDAQVLAFLASVIRTDTNSAKKAKKSQKTFEQYANQMLQAAKALEQACQGRGDFAKAGAARKSLQAACSRCHLDYRPDF